MIALVASLVGFAGFKSSAPDGVAPPSNDGEGALVSVTPRVSGAVQSSAGAEAKAQTADLRPSVGAGRRTSASSSDSCRKARKGLRWYRGWHAYWTRKMGAGTEEMGRRLRPVQAASRTACPRYLAKVFKTKALRARKAYERWYVYHYHWWEWLPLNWQNLGACETGYGKRPGNWEHSNSRFTSAFGISWAEYDANSAYMGGPPWHVRHTPRDQYNAALGHLARFGDGWTCPGP